MATMATGLASGVSFALTDEQRELRALARDFAEKEIRPKAAEYDEHQTHPADVVAKAHEIGLMNLHLPESLGGPSSRRSTGCSSARSSTGAARGSARPSSRTASPPGPISDRWHRRAEAAVARPPRLRPDPRVLRPLRAPGPARTCRGIQTTAVRKGDDYVVNGSKMFITNAGRASWIVCFASTDRSKGHKGLTAFVIPMDADGVTIEKHLDKMGQRATDTSAVAFQDVVVPESSRLGGEGDGFKIAMQTLDSRAPVPPSAQSASRRRRTSSRVDYAKERVQFGMPIAHENQGVSFLVADMATEIEAARLLTWQAAWMIDQGWGRKATKFSSFAKRFAAEWR